MMRKSCCIDDANFTPRSSSCSMVLRSACTHGHHSHNTSAVKKSQHKEAKNLNKKFVGQSTAASNLHSTEKLLDIQTYFQSSLKQFAFKSAKTYSVLKESIYNHFDYSNKLKLKSTNEKEASSETIDDLYSLSKSRESFTNNSLIQEECFLVNNNYITLNNTMPRDFSRSSVTAVNALSDSENEENLSKGGARKRFSKKSSASHSSGKTESLSLNNNSHHHNSVSSVNNVSHTTSTYEATVQGTYTSGSNSYCHTPTSSTLYRSSVNNSKGSDASSTSASPSSPTVIDISNVQYTVIDRFRWFLWRSIYLKVITCVNFDVWLLSRSSNYRKVLVLFLLIPFLIYLLSGIGSSDYMLFEKLHSSAYDFSSSLYSFISSLFTKASTISELSSGDSSTCSKKAYDFISVIVSYIPLKYFYSSNSEMKSSTTDDQILLRIVELEQKVDRLIDRDNSEIAGIRHEVQTVAESFKKLEETVLQNSERFSKFMNSILLNTFIGSSSKKDQKEKESALKRDDYEKLISEIASIRLEVETLTKSFKNMEKSTFQKSERLSKFKNTVLQNIFLSSITAKGHDEKHFIAALKTMIERENDKTSPYYFFIEWIQSKLNADQGIESRLKYEFEKIKTTCAKYDETVIENTIKKYFESFKKDFTSVNKVEISGSDDCSEKYLDVVKKLIREAILLYDADKTGKVDYALESGGGSVLSTRCSESYAEKDGTISVLGLPLWSTHSSPRTVIQPSMQPGQCWAFKGSQGFLVIQLSYTIHVTGFTLEHIPLSLSPSGSIDSAPKDFSVWGLLSEKDNEGKLLGHYTFDQDGDSLQYFPVQNVYNEPFSFVELKILSNWGNLEYTCLYRFRVHGKQPKQ